MHNRLEGFRPERRIPASTIEVFTRLGHPAVELNTGTDTFTCVLINNMPCIVAASNHNLDFDKLSAQDQQLVWETLRQK